MHRYLAAFSAFLLLAACGYAQEQRLVVRRDPKQPSRFICDVKYATFTTPKGWQPNRSGGNTYAILTRSNEVYPKLSEMISIDIGKPVKQTAKETAAAFAKRWNGQVAETKVKIDGEEGYRVLIPLDHKTLRPTDCIVTMRNGRVFLLIGGTRKNEELGKVMDELVASWKWKSKDRNEPTPGARD